MMGIFALLLKWIWIRSSKVALSGETSKGIWAQMDKQGCVRAKPWCSRVLCHPDTCWNCTGILDDSLHCCYCVRDTVKAAEEVEACTHACRCLLQHAVAGTASVEKTALLFVTLGP